jgi:hypothetical protein
VSQAQTGTVRKKAGSVSLSAEFFTLSLHARLRRNTGQPPKSQVVSTRIMNVLDKKRDAIPSPVVTHRRQ